MYIDGQACTLINSLKKNRYDYAIYVVDQNVNGMLTKDFVLLLNWKPAF